MTGDKKPDLTLAAIDDALHRLSSWLWEEKQERNNWRDTDAALIVARGLVTYLELYRDRDSDKT